MYTQCPDCSTAFRVTADVLKQAAGKVRCGGCGLAFNALEYLSESMPAKPAAKEAKAPLPELTPEPRQPEEGHPRAISADQGAALLKTLDELAGSDIRIEDTGVEWRVLDDDEADDGELPSADELAEHGVDELLDESPTPVDQFLTKTPNNIEAREIFEEPGNAPEETPVEELRFDDNTPLPEDFDLGDPATQSSIDAEANAAESQSGPEPRAAHPRDIDDLPVDIALGDPDEWADILGEFSEPPRPYVPPLDAELSALEDELSADDDDSEPALGKDDAAPLDMDTQFALQAEAMGIDLSGLHARHAEASEEDDDNADRAVSIDAGEEFDDAQEDEAAGLELSDESGEMPESESIDVAEETDEEADEETGEVPEIALAGDSGSEPEADVGGETSGDVPDVELAIEADEAQRPDEAQSEAPETPSQLEDVEATRRHGLDEDEDEVEIDDVDEAPLVFGSIEKAMAELEAQSDVFDKGFFKAHDAARAGVDDEIQDDEIVLENDLDGDEIELDDVPESSDSEPPEDTQHVVPPQSEEEQTLNLLIDQDLLSMAVQDEDGFTSTIVFSEKGAAEGRPESIEPQAGEDTGTGFESIIMEGEFVQTALEQEKRRADIKAAAELVEQARQERASEADGRSGSGRRRGMAAAAAALALLLVVQVLHQSREALAKIPAFNEAVGPLYRAIGMPLAPAWDVTGWRFEAKREIPDEEGDSLTVISRIGNTADEPLPYPLINVSLTDRFEETIGNRTLDPGAYLTDDLDPGEMVRPGNNFTAVITIESPPEAATGYKLQVCYRQPDKRLRCHIPNFK